MICLDDDCGRLDVVNGRMIRRYVIYAVVGIVVPCDWVVGLRYELLDWCCVLCFADRW